MCVSPWPNSSAVCLLLPKYSPSVIARPVNENLWLCCHTNNLNPCPWFFFFFSKGNVDLQRRSNSFGILVKKNTVVSSFQCQPGCFLHFQVTYYSNWSNLLKQWVGSQRFHRWPDSPGAHLVWSVSHREAHELCFSMVAHTWPLNCVDCTSWNVRWCTGYKSPALFQTTTTCVPVLSINLELEVCLLLLYLVFLFKEGVSDRNGPDTSLKPPPARWQTFN